MPSVLAEDVQDQQQYRPAPLFELESGEFVVNGARQPVYGTGYDAWVLWCTKAVMTERWAHAAYSGNSGIEADDAFRQPDRKARESAFERTISEALLADPMGRTQQVRDFTFDWSGDSVSIRCVVFGADGNTATIYADLKT